MRLRARLKALQYLAEITTVLAVLGLSSAWHFHQEVITLQSELIAKSEQFNRDLQDQDTKYDKQISWLQNDFVRQENKIEEEREAHNKRLDFWQNAVKDRDELYSKIKGSEEKLYQDWQKAHQETGDWRYLYGFKADRCDELEAKLQSSKATLKDYRSELSRIYNDLAWEIWPRLGTFSNDEELRKGILRALQKMSMSDEAIEEEILKSLEKMGK